MRNLICAFASIALLAACGDGDNDDDPPGADAPASETGEFSFFISSTGGPTGGDFRLSAADTDGLAGADAFCQTKAATADPDAGAKRWRAYLSTSTVNARDRIGTGPWFNRNKVRVATSVENLHAAGANAISKANAIDENGAVVNGRGDTPNHHDILTGSNADGTKSPNHCNNWTSNDDGFFGQVGHHDRNGGGMDPTSWNAAHPSQGCTTPAFVGTGGRGSIYCFAED